MALRRKEPPHENHERWLVSYADFITLLFAFFVVMFASSQTDKSRARQISEAVEKALEQGKSVGVPPAVAKILGGTIDDRGQGNAQMRGPGGAQRAEKKSPEEVLELTPSLQRLTSSLTEEITKGQIEVSLEPRGLVVSLKETAFFPPGSDSIDPSSYSILDKVAVALKEVNNPLRVEGHTDSVPIHNARFHSNWELSAARAIAMMELLASRYEINHQRMAIVGYADTAPETANDTPEGRARNRRVDIVILNKYVLGSPEAKKK